MKKHFFKTFELEFEAQRLLWYCPAGGSDFAEVATVTEKIKDGDYQSWFIEWKKFAEKLENRATTFNNSLTRGNAYLRASRYYQAAEFFLDPTNPEKLAMYKKSVQLFYRGMQDKNITFQENKIIYEDITLRTLYFATNRKESKGTVYICGGFDALMEELYFTSAKYVLESGFDVILYEGPGQSDAIRFAHKPFEKDWHKVVAAVKAYYDANYELNSYTIGIGVSLGGLLMSRTVSLDDTLFDKVVLYDYFPSMLDSFRFSLPSFLHRYLVAGFPKYLEKIVSFYIAQNKFLNWQVEHAKWVFGATSLNNLLQITAGFDERIAYNKFKTDVLVLAGKNDNYYDSKLAQQFFAKIPAPNKKLIMFDKDTYSTDLHCQNGSGYDANDQIIEWLDN